MSVALLLVTALALSPSPQEARPQWLLVRGKADGYAQLALDRIGDVYLGKGNWKLVAAEAAGSLPDTSRMLVGTPDENPALRALLSKLGAELDDGIRYGGRSLESGQGLAVVADDPDGKGRLVLFTGLDATGVGACLSVPVDLGKKGWTIARWQAVLHRRLEDRPGPAFGLARPLVVRLDRDQDHLAATAGGEVGERALHMARGLAGYGFVFEAAYGPRVDLQALMTGALGDGKAAVEAARNRFAEVDLDRRLHELHELCVARLGPVEGARPVYYVLYGSTDGTNARTFGDDPVTGRRRILLNLCRFRDLAELEVATLHETVHWMQGRIGPTLGERVVAEGVATLLSQELRPGTSDALALMWDDAQLRAAGEHVDALCRAVGTLAGSGDAAVHAELLQYGRSPKGIPGAPDRAGYWVGWLAARRWLEQHADPGLRGLLRASPAEVLKTLD